MATKRDFAIALLNRLGIPATQNRIVGLVAFAAIEGGHWAPKLRGSHNPMNTTLACCGGTSITPIGVKAYPDWTSGIEATARTMVQGNMRAMMDALKADADPREFLRGVTHTEWCKGCDYTPYDPYALYNAQGSIDDGDVALAHGGVVASRQKLAIGAIIVLTGLGIFWYLDTDGGAHPMRSLALEGSRKRRRRR